MDTSSETTLALHGACVVRRSGLPAAALERKQAALLAYLWVEGPTPRGKLAGLLWPQVDDARARGNLRQSLSKLRRLAGELTGELQGRLVLKAGIEVAAPEADGTALLGGLGYDDCETFARWLEGQHDARRAVQRRTLLAQVRKCAGTGRLDDALAAADRLLALDRESEEAYRTLMEVCYLRADHAAAISAWDRCREMLRQLYGVAPSAATRQLGETILRAGSQGAPPAVASADAIPVTVLRPPRLVARDAQWQAMLAAWQEGHVVCVTGASGLGKSRLLADACGALGPCVIAVARPGDAVLPYASLSRLLFAAIDRFTPSLAGEDARWAAKMLPRLAPLVAGAPTGPLRTDYERMQALLGVARLLGACARRGCAAFVFDDLQFADAASIEALKLLAEPAAEGAPALRFAFGARLEDLTAEAQALLDSLGATRRLTCIDLAPLSEADVVELLDSLALTRFETRPLARRLWRQVGGNPAFVLESVKRMLTEGTAEPSAAPPLPPGIEAVIERRLALLSPRARHLAQLAAIAGASYSVSLAARALGCAPLELSDPLRELELRQLLHGRRFVHDMIASVIGKSIPAAVSDVMHRFVAEDLEARGGEPALIAEHWQACGEWLLAGRGYRRAAAQAHAASRPSEQGAWLDAAAACLDLRRPVLPPLPPGGRG